jgi:bacterioferritin (cytochrome b1)
MWNIFKKKQERLPLTRSDIINQMQEGLQAERQALSTYKELLPLLSDQGDIDIVNQVISDEGQHIVILNQLLQIVEAGFKESGNN